MATEKKNKEKLFEMCHDRKGIERKSKSILNMIKSDDYIRGPQYDILWKSRIPLPWSVRAPDAKQPPLCSYLRDNPYPESPLNRFVKEQFDYMTCNNPDLKYKEIMAKIDEYWLDLSDEQSEYYDEVYSAESELWEKEHSDLHKQGGCPTFHPHPKNIKLSEQQQDNNPV